MPAVKEKPAKKTAKKEVTAREPKDLTPNMIRVLDCLKDGTVRTATEIAEATDIKKGKRLPDIVAKGYIAESPPKEGERGKKFKITSAGKKALEKAKKEQSK